MIVLEDFAKEYEMIEKAIISEHMTTDDKRDLILKVLFMTYVKGEQDMARELLKDIDD